MISHVVRSVQNLQHITLFQNTHAAEKLQLLNVVGLCAQLMLLIVTEETQVQQVSRSITMETHMLSFLLSLYLSY